MNPVGGLSQAWMDQAASTFQESFDVLKNDVPQLPEHIFCQYLLPILATTAKGEKVDLNVWTDIAGTTYRPIDVIDTAGNVLYRVPSLHRTLPTEVRDRSPQSAQRSVYSIANRSELLSKNSPRAGKAFLNNALSTKVPKVGVDLDRARAFDAILRRYNLPGILPDRLLTNAEERTKSADPDQLIEGFDDFSF